MKQVVVLAFAGCMLSGCSSGLLGGGDRPSASAAQPQIPVNNALALPPDLSLPPPSNRPVAPSLAAADGADAGLNDAVAAPQRKVPQQDLFEHYGISTVKADGTPKTSGELQAELKAAMIAEKRRKNPKYGTIFNVGNIFGDN